MNKPVIVYGSRMLSEMLYNDAKFNPEFDIVAFTQDEEYLNENGEYLGLPQVDFERVDSLYPPKQFDMIVLTASYHDMRNRDEMYQQAKSKGYRLRNYVSPSAIISPGITMGDNNVFFQQVFIGENSLIGSSNTIRQKVYIGHNSDIGDKNVFTPACTIGGNCIIKDSCYIGIGSTILNKVTIGQEALIGGGSVVIKDVKAYTKNVGNPSRVIGTHEHEGLKVMV